jgi:aminoacyl tRNA synthase complex-interacting multifunctional protein 1
VRKSAEALAPAFNLVLLDFSNTPPVERKAIETKKKEKPAKPAENSASAPAGPPRNAVDSATANKAEGSEAKPVKKKGKQEAIAEKDGNKKMTSNVNATPTITEDAGSPSPSMIDLRVGHIIDGTCPH